MKGRQEPPLLDVVARLRPQALRGVRTNGRIVHIHCLCGREDKNPSFAIYTDENRFKCYSLGCPYYGGLDDLLAILGHKREDIAQLAAQSFVDRPQPGASVSHVVLKRTPDYLVRILNASAAWYAEQLWASAGDDARQYLRERGMREETARRMGVGWAPPDYRLDDLLTVCGGEVAHLALSGLIGPSGRPVFRGRLVFPVQRSGAVVYQVGRALKADQEPRYLGLGASLARRCLFYAGHPSNGLVIVEGIMDAAALMQASVDKDCGIIALLGQPKQADIIALARWLGRRRRPVVLLLDRDRAGVHLTLKLAATFAAYGVELHTWIADRDLKSGGLSRPLPLRSFHIAGSDQAKDAGDMMKMGREEALAEAIAQVVAKQVAHSAQAVIG